VRNGGSGGKAWFVRARITNVELSGSLNLEMKNYHVLTLAVALISSVCGADVPLLWSLRRMDDLKVTVGDIVTFSFSPTEGTWPDLSLFSNEQAYSNCDFFSAQALASYEFYGNYSWKATAPGTYYFGCSKQSYCNVHGMRLRVFVSGSTGEAPAPAPEDEKDKRYIPSPTTSSPSHFVTTATSAANTLSASTWLILAIMLAMML
jgi:hypothetical protein